MVDTNEIKELKRLGIVQRKSEVNPEKREYSFKVKCRFCGEKVDWCFCTDTLEGAKKVIEAGQHACLTCLWKPENLTESQLISIAEAILKLKENGFTPDWELAIEAVSETWGDDTGEHYFDEETTYWECECPIDIDHD